MRTKRLALCMLSALLPLQPLAARAGEWIDLTHELSADANHVDEIPLEQLIGDAVVIDVSQAVQADRDHRISVSDIESWEVQHGAIPDDSIVLFRTGFGQYWPDAQKYLGTALRADDAECAGLRERGQPRSTARHRHLRGGPAGEDSRRQRWPVAHRGPAGR